MLTPRMHALCDEAQREGFAVRRFGYNSLLVDRQRPGVAVVVYLTPRGGFATADHATGRSFFALNHPIKDLSACTEWKAVRTLKVVRATLGLEAEA